MSFKWVILNVFEGFVMSFWDYFLKHESFILLDNVLVFFDFFSVFLKTDFFSIFVRFLRSLQAD